MKNFILAAGLLPLVCLRLDAQSFQNLAFEAATITPEQGDQQWPNLVPITSALPGWSAYLGDVEQTMVGQNTYANSVATVAVLGPGWGTGYGPFGVNTGIIDGNYSALLQGGITPDSPASEYVSASIAQTGTVPGTAESLQFKADGGDFSVSFAGNTLPTTLLATATAPSGQLYGVFGIDIAPYAGQTGQLEFTTSDYSSLLLDDIKFSTQVVPEPAPIILTAIGGLVLALRRRFWKQ